MSDLHELFNAATAKHARLRILLPEPVYVAGPMTGYPQWNYPAFDAACVALRGWGLETRSPHELPPDERTLSPDEAQPWDVYMRDAIRTLLDCRSVVLLAGWSTSRGARLEQELAQTLRMPIGFLYLTPTPHVVTFDGTATITP
jgi:hypothetical protein